MSRTDVSAHTLDTWFWDLFTSIIHDQGIKEPYDRWLVRRVERMLQRGYRVRSWFMLNYIALVPEAVQR